MPVNQTNPAAEDAILLHNPLLAGQDEQTKLVFSDKQILAMLLQRCVPACHELSRDELIRRIEGNPEQLKACANLTGEELLRKVGSRITGANTENILPDAGMVRMDIPFFVSPGLAASLPSIPRMWRDMGFFVDIEIQGYEKGLGYILDLRSADYVGRMVAKQKNTLFEGEDYDRQIPVVIIWLILHPGRGEKNTIRYRQPADFDDEGVLLPAASAVPMTQEIFIRLDTTKNGAGSATDPVIRCLNVLLSREFTAKEVQDILKKDGQILMFGDLVKEVNTMYSYALDIFKEGTANGVTKEKAATVDRMIRRGFSDDQIMDSTEVTADYVLAHRQALEQDEKALQKA